PLTVCSIRSRGLSQPRSQSAAKRDELAARVSALLGSFIGFVGLPYWRRGLCAWNTCDVHFPRAINGGNRSLQC
ncbi:MAG: hypothetical protein WAV02_22060, partial [Stellaceae bacterium]